MKVLFINAVCGVGSTGRIVTDLLQELKNNGDEGKVVYAIEPVQNIKPEELIKVGNKVDYYIHNILSRITDKEGQYSKRSTKCAIRKIVEYDPDIIHLHNIHGHYINYVELFDYLKKSNKKIVWTLHDCWAFTGHCAYFSYAQCDQWREGCKKCSQLKAYPKCYFSGNVKNNFRIKKEIFTSLDNLTIVVPSFWLAGLVKKSFLNKYDIRVIHNKIDLNIFKPTPNTFKQIYKIENKKMILGVAGVWSKKKGLYDFIELSKYLSNKYVIVMVGLTVDQISLIKQNIIGYKTLNSVDCSGVIFQRKNEAANSDRNPDGLIGVSSIICIPRTNSTYELAQIYTAADVFLNLTYEDTYPTVNLEALACGTPIVTYKTGGSIEAADEKSGRIVEQGDIRGICKSIEQACEIDSLNALERAKTFKDYGNYIDLYNQIYYYNKC